MHEWKQDDDRENRPPPSPLPTPTPPPPLSQGLSRSKNDAGAASGSRRERREGQASWCWGSRGRHSRTSFFFFWIKGSSFMFLLYFSFLIVKQGCDCSVKIEKILKPIKRKLRLSIPTLWEHYNLGVHHFYLFLEYSKNL